MQNNILQTQLQETPQLYGPYIDYLQPQLLNIQASLDAVIKTTLYTEQEDTGTKQSS